MIRLSWLILWCLLFVDIVRGDECTENPGAFCVGEVRCPHGYVVSFSGCGYDKLCCLPSSPVALTTPWVSTTTEQPQYQPAPPCGQSMVNPDSRIVGGEETTVDAHPWMVDINLMGFHHCGGSLISDQWILTAAHCLDDEPMRIKPAMLKVLVASTDNKVFSKALEVPVDSFLLYPRYNSTYLRNDIALIKLTKRLDLNGRTTRAVCLPKQADNFDTKQCYVTGWGDLSERGNETNILHHVSLPVVSRAECKSYVYHILPEVICAGDVTGHRDSCSGDSGGPLVCQSSTGQWTQAGVVSKGLGCARKGQLGFYTDVAQFRSWIDSVIQ